MFLRNASITHRATLPFAPMIKIFIFSPLLGRFAKSCVFHSALHALPATRLESTSKKQNFATDWIFCTIFWRILGNVSLCKDFLGDKNRVEHARESDIRNALHKGLNHLLWRDSDIECRIDMHLKLRLATARREQA